MGLRWVGGCHDLEAVPGGFQCSRCHLAVAPTHAAKTRASRCPGWWLQREDGSVVEGSAHYGAWLAEWPTKWKASVGGRVRPAPVARLPTRKRKADRPVPVAPAKRLRPFRSHVFVHCQGLSFCIACGLRKSAGRGLERRSCSGAGRLQADCLRAFEMGLLGDSICRNAVAVACAELRGRRLELRPREPD